MGGTERLFDGTTCTMALPVGITEFVSLVKNNKIPRDQAKLIGHTCGEVVGNNCDNGLVEGFSDPFLALIVPSPCIQHLGGKMELLRKLISPLFTKSRRAHDD